MKLETQVVNLDLSKQLKEAGYKQEGLWWWRLYPSKEYGLASRRGDLAWLQSHSRTENWKDIDYVAPTVAELGEVLPWEKITWCGKDLKGDWRIDEQDGGHTGIMIIADTLASVVGKRWGRIKIKFPWTSARTVLGSLTMFGCAFLVCIGSFWYFGYFNPLTQVPLTWDIIFLYAFITAILATIIEILSPSTFDDLTVPIGTTIIIYLLTFIYL